MTRYVEMQVACGSETEASTIAEALVGDRLAACVQVFPIRSTYRWHGRVEHDEELLLLVKTHAELADAIRDRVVAMHSYEVPTITWVEIAGGSPDYLAWIDAETTPAD